MLTTACEEGQTKYTLAKTHSGLKDNVLEHFVGKILSFRKNLQGTRDEKVEAVRKLVEEEIPKEPYSPVWRIRGVCCSSTKLKSQFSSKPVGLDPHQDTPVEILHVVLLGFVKYFWRDAIARIQSKDKPILVSRIDSVDVSGLGISAPSGHTLVTYAGSLTGRDFRVIAQIAPFVLHGLVTDKCYDVWLALSRMVPLIWQPTIRHRDKYLVKVLSSISKLHDLLCLQGDIKIAIDNFLVRTALLSPRWYNKPKFHILQHLVEHIRRFGPAILFATEGFESYNAIIRGASVHSNRQAPSRDIAVRMARTNRIRHLLSGGYFLPSSERWNIDVASNAREWKTVGSLVRSTCMHTAGRHNALARYLIGDGDGLEVEEMSDQQYPGTVGRMISSNRTWSQTQASKCFSSTDNHTPEELTLARYDTFDSIIDLNGRICPRSSFILFTKPPVPNDPVERTVVGKLLEVLHFSDFFYDGIQNNSRSRLLLIEEYPSPGIDQHYKLPSLQKGQIHLLDVEVCLTAVYIFASLTNYIGHVSS